MTATGVGAPTKRLNFLRATLLLVVVLLSAFIQFTVVTRTTVEHPVQSDAIKYVTYAWNLVHDGTFSHTPFWTSPAEIPVPDKLTLPGYPGFLALFLGDHVDQAFLHRVVIAQACLGVLTCALTLLLALRILPFGFAVAAGLLVAISPHLASISTYLLTESLFTALLTVALYLGVRAAAAKTLRPAALAGAALALASLVRPQMQLFPWVLLALCMGIPSWRKHARKSALALLVFAAVMAPWQLRNLGVDRVQGDPDLLVNTLYHGSFPGLMYEDIPQSAGYPYQFDPGRLQHTADVASVLRYIAEGFRSQPARYVHWYLLGKPAMFLSWTDPANAGDIFIYSVLASPYLDRPFFDGMNRLMFWLHWPLMVLALGTLFVAAIRPKFLSPDPGATAALRLLALTLGYVLFMHMLGAPFPRYAIPFRPLTYLLGVAMASAAWTTVVTKKVTFIRAD